MMQGKKPRTSGPASAEPEPERRAEGLEALAHLVWTYQTALTRAGFANIVEALHALTPPPAEESFGAQHQQLHPITCGLCPWGRIPENHSQEAYEKHVLEVHPWYSVFENL